MRRIPYYTLAALMILNMAATMIWHCNGVGFSISLLMILSGPLAWRCTGITLPDRLLPTKWDVAKWQVYLTAPMACLIGTARAALDGRWEDGLVILMMLVIVGSYIVADRLVHHPDTKLVPRTL